MSNDKSISTFPGIIHYEIRNVKSKFRASDTRKAVSFDPMNKPNLARRIFWAVDFDNLDYDGKASP